MKNCPVAMHFLDLLQCHKDWIDRKVKDYTLSTPHTLYGTAAIAGKVLIDEISGALVECGVWKGAHPAIMSYMARYCNQHGRIIYLFDSFEGLPKSTSDDPGMEHIPSGELAVPLKEVRKYMTEVCAAEEGTLRFIKGWFEDTVPEKAKKIGPIALLRLDGDLYESTKVCMEHLYPKVSPGGFVIIDDWQLSGVRKAVCEVVGDVVVSQFSTETVCWRKE